MGATVNADAVRDQTPWRRALLRPPVRSCLHVSQRGGVLLCREGLPRVAEGLAADLLHAGSGGQRSPRIPPPPQYFTSWSCIASPSGSVKYSSGVPPSAPPRSGMRREM